MIVSDSRGGRGGLLIAAALIILYKKNYGNLLSENTQRNLQILQFLVQLNSWVLNRLPHLEDLAPHMSTGMRDQQKHDMLVNQCCRRVWLKAGQKAQTLGYTEASDLWRLRNSQLCLADHLLPLFMWVSTNLFKLSKRPPAISLEWMRLAVHLMVQAAIEILDAPDLLVSGSNGAQNALQECFAWGALEDTQSACSVDAIADEMRMRGFPSTHTRSLHEVVNKERDCQRMFKEYTEDGKQPSIRESVSGSQIPPWDAVKQEALEDVLMTFTSIQEAGTDLSHRPIELLRSKYRLTTLLADINDFIAIHWRLLHSKAWHRKPVLVQIEEGGLDGLTPAEFEEFKTRVCIQEMFDFTSLIED